MKTFSVLGAIAAFSFIGQTIAAPTAFAVVKRDDLKVEEDLVTVLVRKSDLEDRGLVSNHSQHPSFLSSAAN